MYTLTRTACCTATMVDGGSGLVVGGSFLSLLCGKGSGASGTTEIGTLEKMEVGKRNEASVQLTKEMY